MKELVEGEKWASPATGMEFVWIPQMGMWVGKYEVTNEEYRRKEPGHDSGSYEGHTLNRAPQPVVYVNFYGAKAYAAGLTQQASGGAEVDGTFKVNIKPPVNDFNVKLIKTRPADPPAQLSKISTLPYFFTASATAPFALISSAAAVTASSLTSASTTFAPSSANFRAVSNPIPEPAPLTTAV